MILKPTTIVLGAGASMPYGMPSGAKLRSLICNGQADLAGTLQEMPHIEAGDTIDFIKNFSRSNVASIDAFLSRHERFFEIGKLCIAAILCAKEDPAKVMNNDAEDHWYQHMWQILIDGADTHNDLRRNKISFVTFNYDRSLEYFLHQSTKHTFGVSDQEAFTVVKNLRILHVYGLLGEFSYSPSQGARQYINDHLWPIVSRVILPQANIDKGFDMILNSGDLKLASVFRPPIFGLYRCRFFRQARQSNESWQNRIRAVVGIHPLRSFRTSGRSLRGQSRCQ